MPLLGVSDQLPSRPSRVLVAGTSGSGKTTSAAQIGHLLQVPHVEIDALFHGPDWTPRPSFVTDVQALAAGATWVTEWQYGSVRELLADRADLLVWLDLPRSTVLRQVVGRTVRRRARRQPLWNGNQEPPLHTFFTDPDHIVRWAWRTHPRSAQRVTALLQRRPGLPLVQLTTRRDDAAYLAGPLQQSIGARRPGG